MANTMISPSPVDGDLKLYSIQINRWLLKPIGVWPVTLCSGTMEQISIITLALISTCLIGYLLVPCALCAILDKNGDLDAKIKMIGPLSFCVMAAIKYCILVFRGKQISECVRNIWTDWGWCISLGDYQNKEIMIESARFGRFLAVFCAGFMYSGGFFYTTVMPLCSKRTEIIDNETVRSLAFPIYRGIIDPRTSPSFEIAQLLQCLAGFVIYSVTVGACSLAAVFVMHACGQFKILSVRLNQLVSPATANSNRKNVKDCLGDIVQHHLRILRWRRPGDMKVNSFFFFNGTVWLFIYILIVCFEASTTTYYDGHSKPYKVEGLLNEICFVEFVGCTLNICFLGYFVLTEWEHSDTVGAMTYCILLISFTFNIFILCYIGEILSEECIKLGLTAYMINWYRLPARKALGLVLMLAISNSSTKLTAGKIVNLSLSSFCSVLKSSLAYLSLLRTLTT